MSDDTRPSIAELEAKLERWTKFWTAATADQKNRVGFDSEVAAIEVPLFNAAVDAAPALLSIARAALALRDSRCDCTSEFHDSTSQACPMGAAEIALANALEAVTP